MLQLLGRDYRAGVFLPHVLQRLVVAYSAFAGQLQHVLEGHTDCVSAVCALPDGRVLSGSCDKTLRVWNLTSGACEAVLKGHTDAVKSVCALPDGRVVSGSSDQMLRVWY